MLAITSEIVHLDDGARSDTAHSLSVCCTGIESSDRAYKMPSESIAMITVFVLLFFPKKSDMLHMLYLGDRLPFGLSARKVLVAGQR